MRTTRDRIRHAISFELIGLMIFVPLATLAFDTHPQDLGVIAIVASVIATGWNYVYNIGFDRAMLRLRGDVVKTPALRVLHALLFEGGLLIATLPIIAIYLRIGLWEAFVLDAAVAGFYLVYAFVFNWAYDRVFPLPQASSSASQ